MTVNFGKSTNKKASGSTKLSKGSWRDNMPEPFHTKRAVEALFNNVELHEKKLKS